MIYETYISKEKRDTRYKELKAKGVNVHKSSISNQLLHPQYVTDYEGEAKNDTGFGNIVYKTYFAKLYKLEEF